MNDEIDEFLIHLLRKIRAFGQGALTAKANIKSAFQLLPISPVSYNSLGFCLDYTFLWHVLAHRLLPLVRLFRKFVFFFTLRFPFWMRF